MKFSKKTIKKRLFFYNFSIGLCLAILLLFLQTVVSADEINLLNQMDNDDFFYNSDEIAMTTTCSHDPCPTEKATWVLAQAETVNKCAALDAAVNNLSLCLSGAGITTATACLAGFVAGSVGLLPGALLGCLGGTFYTLVAAGLTCSLLIPAIVDAKNNKNSVIIFETSAKSDYDNHVATI